MPSCLRLTPNRLRIRLQSSQDACAPNDWLPHCGSYVIYVMYVGVDRGYTVTGRQPCQLSDHLPYSCRNSRRKLCSTLQSELVMFLPSFSKSRYMAEERMIDHGAATAPKIIDQT